MRRGYLCVVYVSCAKPSVLSDLTAGLSLSSAAEVSLAHSFRDEAYNRTSFYFISKEATQLTSPAVSLCKRAFKLCVSPSVAACASFSHLCRGFTSGLTSLGISASIHHWVR